MSTDNPFRNKEVCCANRPINRSQIRVRARCRTLVWVTDAHWTWKKTLARQAEHADVPMHDDAHLATQYTPKIKAMMPRNRSWRDFKFGPPGLQSNDVNQKFVSRKSLEALRFGLVKGLSIVAVEAAC